VIGPVAVHAVGVAEGVGLDEAAEAGVVDAGTLVDEGEAGLIPAKAEDGHGRACGGEGVISGGGGDLFIVSQALEAEFVDAVVDVAEAEEIDFDRLGLELRGEAMNIETMGEAEAATLTVRRVVVALDGVTGREGSARGFMEVGGELIPGNDTNG